MVGEDITDSQISLFAYYASQMKDPVLVGSSDQIPAPRSVVVEMNGMKDAWRYNRFYLFTTNKSAWQMKAPAPAAASSPPPKEQAGARPRKGRAWHT